MVNINCGAGATTMAVPVKEKRWEKKKDGLNLFIDFEFFF